MSASAHNWEVRRSVCLIGMRGAGKTTVGRELARLLELGFVDTDSEIERSVGRAIADIFAVEGEAAFRAREVVAIRDAVAQAPCVISVGGGAVCDPENVRRLRSCARVVWLRAPVNVLWERISADGASSRSRPSLTGQGGIEELQTLLSRREALYRACADVTLDTEARSPDALARELQARLGV